MPARISIITPSFNQCAYIEQTIRSVQQQDYPNTEHVVIDGGSTDGTVEVLKKFPHLIWISEKDKGQADALRKGFELVTGDIVGWINSDDYYEQNVFGQVSECFDDPQTSWLVGNLSYLFADGQVVPDRSPEVTRQRLLEHPDIVRQQPTFFRKELLKRAGGWNPDLQLVMDFDLWLRLAALATPKRLDFNLAYFRMHAEQKTSLDNYLKQGRELDQVLRRQGVPLIQRLPVRMKKRWMWFKGHIKKFCLENGLISPKYRNRPVVLKSRDM